MKNIFVLFVLSACFCYSQNTATTESPTVTPDTNVQKSVQVVNRIFEIGDAVVKHQQQTAPSQTPSAPNTSPTVQPSASNTQQNVTPATAPQQEQQPQEDGQPWYQSTVEWVQTNWWWLKPFLALVIGLTIMICTSFTTSGGLLGY